MVYPTAAIRAISVFVTQEGAEGAALSITAAGAGFSGDHGQGASGVAVHDAVTMVPLVAQPARSAAATVSTTNVSPTSSFSFTFLGLRLLHHRGQFSGDWLSLQGEA